MYTSQKVVSSSFVIAGSLSDFDDATKNDIAAKLAAAAGVDADDVKITAVAGSIKLIVDILTTSTTPTAVLGALSTTFASESALSAVLGDSVTVEAITSPPAEETKLIMVAAPSPPPPLSPSTALGTVEILLYIGAPTLAVVLIAMGLIILHIRRKRRAARKAKLAPSRSLPEPAPATAASTFDDGAPAGIRPKETFVERKLREQKAERDAKAAARAAEIAEEEAKAAAVQSEADRIAAEKAAIAKAAEDEAAALRAIADQIAAEKKAEEDRLAAIKKAAEDAAAEKLRMETEKFWTEGPTPDHRTIPKLVTSNTRNGVNDARQELERLWAFVGMSPKSAPKSPLKTPTKTKDRIPGTVIV